jgi:hypothetical protein
MKKRLGNKLAVATFAVSVLYVFIFLFSRIDLIQKQNNGALKQNAKAAYTCPSGYIAIADFCIQSDLAGNDSWYDAAQECAENENARLCRAQELMAACQAEKEYGVSFDDNIDGDAWEWADDIAESGQAVMMFDSASGCNMVGKGNLTSGARDFRCCLNMY